MAGGPGPRENGGSRRQMVFRRATFVSSNRQAGRQRPTFDEPASEYVASYRQINPADQTRTERRKKLLDDQIIAYTINRLAGRAEMPWRGLRSSPWGRPVARRQFAR